MKKSWEPLLKGEQTQLKAIITALENAVPDKTNSLLNGGNTGAAILLYYYWLYTNNSKYLEKANAMMLNGFQLTNQHVHSLCSGTAGFRWAVNHLISNKFIEGDCDELFSEDDAFLHTVMKNDIDEGRYDFLHNALGIGLYFLNRGNSQSLAYIESLISSLEKTAETDSSGLKWRSVLHLNETDRKEAYNLSLSHGMASIIAFLAKAYQNNIARQKTRNLLDRGISYILSKKLDAPDSDYGSYFPSVVYADGSQSISGSRLAWCYGDLGLAYALWQVSEITEDTELNNIALAVLLHTTTRKDPDRERVVDAGICHGAAGIAHIYNRVYQHTGITTFKDVALFWLRDTLNKAVFTDGLAGYKAWHAPDKGGWQNQAGLLEGISGIGLVLLSAISDIEPKWDECLLLS